MYKAELELEKRLNDIALANVPATSYENIVIVPKFKHYAPLDMSPDEFDLRDLAIEQKMNVISLNAIVNKLGWKPSKIKSDVTKEMIADYQLEMMKNVKNGVYIPASVDLDLLELPDPPLALDPRDEKRTRESLSTLATRLAEVQGILRDAPNAIAAAQAGIGRKLEEDILRVDTLYPTNPLKRARRRATLRRQFDADIEKLTTVEAPNYIARLQTEYNDLMGQIDAINQALQDSSKNTSDYQRELSGVRDENARRRKIYEEQIRTLNRGVNIVAMLPDETVDEYKQRLKDIGDSTANGTAVEAAASLLYTDRLREKMTEITRDDVLVGDFIRRLSTDERYSLVKVWDTFKKKVLEIFGRDNKFMSADDLVNIAEELADIVAIRAIAEPVQFKEDDVREAAPIRAFVVEEGTDPAVAAPPERYVLSRNAASLRSARKEALLAYANEGRPIPRQRTLNPDSEAIYRAELALIEEFIRRRGGGGESRTLPTLTDEPGPIFSEPRIPDIEDLRDEVRKMQDEAADEDFRAQLNQFLTITDARELVRRFNASRLHFAFENRGRGLSGRGLHAKYPKIMPFGLIELSPHKLFYENVLKITRKGKHLTGFPNVKVSNEFVTFIFKILDGQQPTLRDVNQLSAGEKQLFDSLIFTAGLQKKVDSTGSGVKQTLKDRLRLIEGEIEAGNTSDLLIKEARKILQHLARMKIIGHRAASGHLKQLINAQRG
jgi:hypothetical protein